MRAQDRSEGRRSLAGTRELPVNSAQPMALMTSARWVQRSPDKRPSWGTSSPSDYQWNSVSIPTVF